MNAIDTVKIENLWGSGATIEFNCDRKFNFLIGQNGTGKTTVINLIAATLTGNFEKLSKVEFDKIIITLKPESGSKKPSIEVTKPKKSDRPFNKIIYNIKSSKKENPMEIYLAPFDQDGFFWGSQSKILKERFFENNFPDIHEQLDYFINVSWLSIHRQNDEIRTTEDRRSIPPIDQKLQSLNNSLVKHFSSLSKKYSDDIIEFQKKTLLSVITSETNEKLFAFSKSIDIEEEKKSLAGIFEVLGVEEKNYSNKIHRHFDRFRTAIKSKNEDKSISVEQFSAIYNVWQSHSLVQEYENLQNKKTEIFKSRDNFLEVLNNLLSGRKKASLSEKNELVFDTKNGKRIPLNELSSGEKQLLIILGEALLQLEKTTIYIADEPELSLHLSWQEALITSISKLNHNAQIIFATHSPDIVAHRSDFIINMEDVIK